MDKDNRNKLIGHSIGIVILIIIAVIIGYFSHSFIVSFGVTALGFILLIALIGPVILEEIRNKQVSRMKKKGKYSICPQCKEVMDNEKGICPSCGYKL